MVRRDRGNQLAVHPGLALQDWNGNRSQAAESPRVARIDRTGRRVLTGLLRAFRKEVLKPEIGSRLLIDSLSQALAVYLIRRCTNRQLTNGQPLIIPKWRIRRAQDFIRENLNNGISLKEIVDAAGDVSPYHFSRLFKQATGFSPYQFLIECRVLAAQKLLRAQRGLSLGEIAFRCGFADQSSFTRCFRQRTGLTPKQYRDG